MNNSSNIFLPKRVSSGARKQAPSGSGKPNQNVPLYKFYLKTFADAVGRRLKEFKPMSYSSGTPAVSSQQKSQQASRPQVSTGRVPNIPRQTGVGHRFSKQQFANYVGNMWLDNEGADNRQVFRRDEQGETSTLHVPGRPKEVWRSDDNLRTWRRTA